MGKREWRRIVIGFGVILLLAIFSDINSGNLKPDGTIEREEPGGEKKSVSLILDVEGLINEYSYELEIEPERVSSEQAEEFFVQTKKIIEHDFENIGNTIPINESYIAGIVEARWNFEPYGYITSDGEIRMDKMTEKSVLINAQVELFCGDYEMLYQFPFVLEKPEVSQQEVMIEKVSQWIEAQMLEEGVSNLKLPEEIEGVKLTWSEKKDYLFLKVLFLECIAVIAIFIGNQREKEKKQKLVWRKREEDYPDLVNQLLVLLGAGMTIRQAWNRIGAQYEEKREKKMIGTKEVYEEILCMNRQINEGEKERLVYQNFADRMEILCYRRLMRMLLHNLEKGTKDLCSLLEEECRQAYGQRILIAKTKGEEASTKMLIPLMMMMVLVMVIVLLPAIINFSI